VRTSTGARAACRVAASTQFTRLVLGYSKVQAPAAASGRANGDKAITSLGGISSVNWYSNGTARPRDPSEQPYQVSPQRRWCSNKESKET